MMMTEGLAGAGTFSPGAMFVQPGLPADVSIADGAFDGGAIADSFEISAATGDVAPGLPGEARRLFYSQRGFAEVVPGSAGGKRPGLFGTMRAAACAAFWELLMHYGEAAKYHERAGSYGWAVRCYLNAQMPSEAARVRKETGDEAGAAKILMDAAAASRKKGDFESAAKLYEEAGEFGEAAGCWKAAAEHFDYHYVKRQDFATKAAVNFDRAGKGDEAAALRRKLGEGERRDIEHAFRHIEGRGRALQAAANELRHIPAGDESLYRHIRQFYTFAERRAGIGEMFEGIERYSEAAMFHEMAGNLAKAVELFRRAGKNGDAERILRETGELERVGAVADLTFRALGERVYVLSDVSQLGSEGKLWKYVRVRKEAGGWEFRIVKHGDVNHADMVRDGEKGVPVLGGNIIYYTAKKTVQVDGSSGSFPSDEWRLRQTMELLRAIFGEGVEVKVW